MTPFINCHGSFALRYAVVSGLSRQRARRTVKQSLDYVWRHPAAPDDSLTLLYQLLTQQGVPHKLIIFPAIDGDDGRIAQVLASLPLEIRQAWCLSLWYHWPSARIGHVLGQDPLAVERFLTHARHTFSTVLGDRQRENA
ncbi:MAG: hypothetical protein M0Z53_14995 [Thermaerobacter sp.]|nr:hypothetical protein [Thermaerobacter sp.]